MILNCLKDERIDDSLAEPIEEGIHEPNVIIISLRNPCELPCGGL